MYRQDLDLFLYSNFIAERAEKHYIYTSELLSAFQSKEELCSITLSTERYIQPMLKSFPTFGLQNCLQFLRNASLLRKIFHV